MSAYANNFITHFITRPICLRCVLSKNVLETIYQGGNLDIDLSKEGTIHLL